MGDLGELGGEAGRATGGSCPQERHRHRSQIEERQLGGGAWADGARGRPCRAAVVGVIEAELARTDQPVTGDVAASGADDELAAADCHRHPAADERAWHAVAGRAIADGAQRSTVRVAVGEGDGRSDGSARRRVRSTASRSTGRAAISECR
jgi:hypothetical protein